MIDESIKTTQPKRERKLSTKWHNGGMEKAPEPPKGVGFTGASDISDTGNYFTDGVYNNG